MTITKDRSGIEFIGKGFEIEGRIDAIEAEQFIATNIWEWSNFTEKTQKENIELLINHYNEILE